MHITRTLKTQLQSGISLVEMLVGITVGLFVVAGVIILFSNSVSSSTQVVRMAKLEGEMNAIMQLMVNEIHRAGYCGDITACMADNPFSTITITDFNNADTAVFLYDADQDGVDDGSSERFGLLLNSGVMQMSISGAWNALNDINGVQITAFNVSTEGSKCINTTSNITPWQSAAGATTFPCSDTATTGYSATANDKLVETRQITLNLTGQLATDSNVTKTLSASVKVRNDRSVTVPSA